MGFTMSKKEGEVSAEPNVVPLCDVLLVLLIIFMVVTPLIQRGVDVKLPTAINTMDMPENPEVVVYIKKDGMMVVNSDKVQGETFETRGEFLMTLLEEALMEATDKNVYLRADSDLEYGIILEYVPYIKDAGVDKINIIVDKKAQRID
jgi:biopolymer transport protein TolR